MSKVSSSCLEDRLHFRNNNCNHCFRSSPDSNDCDGVEIAGVQEVLNRFS